MNPQYIRETAETRAQAVTDLQAAVKEHGYGVLHIYDLKERTPSLSSKLIRKTLVKWRRGASAT